MPQAQNGAALNEVKRRSHRNSETASAIETPQAFKRCQPFKQRSENGEAIETQKRR